MKRVLFIILSICCSLLSSAQKIHFTDTSNVWSQFYDSYNDGKPPIYTYGIHSFINDTTIASVDYKVFNFGIVREDTSLGKVYIRDVLNDSDIVLMNYHLNVGDSFTTGYDAAFHFYYTYVVSGIDSTLINGVWYKVWHFPSLHTPRGPNWPSDVIEGVGCIQHPTYLIWHGVGEYPIDPKVYCFSNRDITPPISPIVSWLDNSTSCSTFLTLHANQLQIGKDNIEMYPNPATTSLAITSSDMITTIAIINLVGQTVYSNSYHDNEVQVDISSLSAGMYLIRINGTEIRKFVKQ